MVIDYIQYIIFTSPKSTVPSGNLHLTNACRATSFTAPLADGLLGKSCFQLCVDCLRNHCNSDCWSPAVIAHWLWPMKIQVCSVWGQTLCTEFSAEVQTFLGPLAFVLAESSMMPNKPIPEDTKTTTIDVAGVLQLSRCSSQSPEAAGALESDRQTISLFHSDHGLCYLCDREVATCASKHLPNKFVPQYTILYYSIMK